MQYDDYTISTLENGRCNYFKDVLAKELNAVHYSGADNALCKKFPIEKNSQEVKANFIVGEKDGNEYCFGEYYKRETTGGKHSRDCSHWQTFGFVKVNNTNMPEFTLCPKKQTIAQMGCMGLFFCVWLGPFILGFTYLLVKLVGEKLYIGIIIFSLILLFLFIFIKFTKNNIFKVLLGSFGKAFFQLFEQGRFRVDQEFKNKYLIMKKEGFNERDFSDISNLFNHDICSKILKHTPDIEGMHSEKNCLVNSNFEQKKFTKENFIKFLDDMVSQAKIFEKQNSF